VGGDEAEALVKRCASWRDLLLVSWTMAQPRRRASCSLRKPACRCDAPGSEADVAKEVISKL
jgi:hypothetical protein